MSSATSLDVRRALGAALLTAFAAGAAPSFVPGSVLLAQDKGEGLPAPGPGGGGREVTPEMEKICPELKGKPEGRTKDQLLALFFDLDWQKAQEPATKRLAKDTFDLTKEGPDTQLLDKLLAQRGPARAVNGIRAVIAAWEGRGFIWALGRIEKQKAKADDSLGRLIESLLAVDGKEAWRFLERSLDDKTRAPNWRAAQEAPPGYEDLRVCDLAFRQLGQRLIDAPGVTFPPELKNGQIMPLMPLEARDKKIEVAKKWIAADKAYADYRDKKPSVAASLDDAGKKELADALKKAGVE